MRGKSESGGEQAEAGPYSRHIPALDGVRGLAVLAVIATHLFNGNADTPLTRSLARVVLFGTAGVDLFFVLSGLLITGILYDSLGEDAYFRKFYARRALRIFPLYYGVLLCFFATTVFFGKHYQHELLSLALYLQNTNWMATPLWLYQGPPPLPLWHFWTLAIEEQFYLFWPLAVFLLRDRRRILWVCFVGIACSPVLRVVAILSGTSYGAVNASTLCRMDSLLAGAALALLLRGPLHDRVLQAGWWLIGAGAVIETVCQTQGGAREPVASVFSSLHYTAMSAASVGLLAVCLRRDGAVGRAFSAAGMRWLGRYSYGIYVLHMILRGWLMVPMKTFLFAHVVPNKGAVVILTGFLLIGVTMLAAWVSYNVYEVRFLRLKRWFAYTPR